MDEIMDIDQILVDCENFAENKKGPPLPRTRKAWVTTTPRKGKKYLLYENLMPRIKAAEDTLRRSLSEMIESNYNLILESRKLESKLTRSITFHSSFLASFDTIILDMKIIYKRIGNELIFLKSAMAFNEEIIRLKIMFKGQGMGAPRSLKARMVAAEKEKLTRSYSEDNLAQDPDHSGLLARDENLKQCKERLVCSIEELSSIRRARLDACEGVQAALKILVKAFQDCEGDIPRSSNLGDEASDADSDSVFEDTESALKLAAHADLTLRDLSGEIIEVTRRLALLVQMREAVRERGEQLDLNQSEDDSLEGKERDWFAGVSGRFHHRTSLLSSTSSPSQVARSFADIMLQLDHPLAGSMAGAGAGDGRKTPPSSAAASATSATVGGVGNVMGIPDDETRELAEEEKAAALAVNYSRNGAISPDGRNSVESSRLSGPLQSVDMGPPGVWNRMRTSVRGVFKRGSTSSPVPFMNPSSGSASGGGEGETGGGSSCVDGEKKQEGEWEEGGNPHVPSTPVDVLSDGRERNGEDEIKEEDQGSALRREAGTDGSGRNM